MVRVEVTCGSYFVAQPWFQKKDKDLLFFYYARNSPLTSVCGLWTIVALPLPHFLLPVYILYQTIQWVLLSLAVIWSKAWSKYTSLFFHFSFRSLHTQQAEKRVLSRQILVSSLFTPTIRWRVEQKKKKRVLKQEKKMIKEKKRKEKWTRPDTRQSSRGRLGRSSNAKITRNSKMWPTDGPTDGRTDRPTDQGVESRVRD